MQTADSNSGNNGSGSTDRHTDRHIVLFDLYDEGHHAVYFWQLCRYWIEHDLHGRLTVAVPPSYATAHPDLIAYLERHTDAGVQVHFLHEQPPLAAAPGGRQLLHNDRLHGAYAAEVIRALRPTHFVFLYLDHAQVSLIRNLRFHEDVHLAGILFRPTFHYEELGFKPASLGERLWHFRKKVILKLALRNPHLKLVFSLDPYAAEPMRHLNATVDVRPLPDGYTPTPANREPSELRRAYGIDEHRRVALFFGVVSERKGILRVLDSLSLIPPDVQTEMTLLIVGKAPETERARIQDRIDQIRSASKVQIVWENTFVPDEAIQDYFRGADLALVTYQRHIGSSHVLIRAAAEAVPVLGSDYGVVGLHIRNHRLGMAVDTMDSSALAKSLEAWLTRDQVAGFDASQAQQFAAANEVRHFAATFFDALTPH